MERSVRSLSVAVTALLVACGESTAPSPAGLTLVTTSIDNAVLGASYTQQLEATGGTLPYVWSITAGSLPPGLDLDTSTGQITGVPTVLSATDLTVRVSSSDGQSASVDLEIGVFALLAISTTSLPIGIAEALYSVTLTAVGGDGGVTWALTDSLLPAGLTLDPTTGVISGTPTSIGTTELNFEVSSGDGQVAEVTLSLTVYGALTFATDSLPNAVQNAPYSGAVQVTGGSGVNTWSLAAGSLPTGLSLNVGSGLISGTPTNVESETFTVQVDSGDGQTAQIELDLSVYLPLVMQTIALTHGDMDEAYADTLEASGGDGTYTWSITSGSLVAGLTFGADTGELAGTPTAFATGDLTFHVESGDGQTAQRILTMRVFPDILTPAEDCSSFLPESKATFADATLDEAIHDELGLGLGLPLTCGVLSTIGALDVRGYGIVELTGLQNLSAVEILLLSDNSITDLGPLSGLTSIQRLHIARNAVTDISALAGLTAMTYLDASSNNISDVTPLQGLVALDRLFLGDNSIVDLAPLSGLSALDQLWIGENSIVDVTALGGLIGLQDLAISYNSITDISPLASLTSLTQLRLSGNPIADLSTVSGLTNLESLSLFGYGLTDISFLSGLTQMQVMDLGYNQISDLSPLSAMTQMTYLSLNSNLVTDLSPLSGLTQMEALLLGGNSVSDISALAGANLLQDLWLNGNSITDISVLEDMTVLGRLLLEDNVGLSDIQPLLSNTGIGVGTQVTLEGTAVSCVDVALLKDKGVSVSSDCP